jgi:hypothetical protein
MLTSIRRRLAEPLRCSTSDGSCLRNGAGVTWRSKRSGDGLKPSSLLEES